MTSTSQALHMGTGEVVRRHLAAAQAKWRRLTISDYAEIDSTDALIATVEFRYSLPHDEARRDVHGWLTNVGHPSPQLR